MNCSITTLRSMGFREEVVGEMRRKYLGHGSGRLTKRLARGIRLSRGLCGMSSTTKWMRKHSPLTTRGVVTKAIVRWKIDTKVEVMNRFVSRYLNGCINDLLHFLSLV